MGDRQYDKIFKHVKQNIIIEFILWDKARKY